MEDYDRLREAIFDRFSSEKTTCKGLANRYGVSVRRLRTAWHNKGQNPPDLQSESYRDIHLQIQSTRRPTSLLLKDETVIVQAIKYFAENCTPLTKEGVIDLVQEYVILLPSKLRQKNGFIDNRP